MPYPPSPHQLFSKASGNLGTCWAAFPLSITIWPSEQKEPTLICSMYKKRKLISTTLLMNYKSKGDSKRSSLNTQTESKNYSKTRANSTGQYKMASGIWKQHMEHTERKLFV